MVLCKYGQQRRIAEKSREEQHSARSTRIAISGFMVSRGGEGLFERIATIIQFPGCSVLFGGTAEFNRLGEIELQFPSVGNYCLYPVFVATIAKLRSAKYQGAGKTAGRYV